MKHYVMLKFRPGFYNEEILGYTKEIFSEIEKQILNVKNVSVFSNCIERDANMDMMIEMDVENEETLQAYLSHELHKEFVNTTDKHVVLRVSFDYK